MVELVLEYACGCRESFGEVVLLPLPPGEPAVKQCPDLCVPESCPTCGRGKRRCAARRHLTGALAYTPITWSDDAPRKRPTRLTPAPRKPKPLDAF